MRKFLYFVKENWVFFVVYLFVFLFLVVKLPYYIDAPGGLINVDKRIQVEGGYSSTGSLNLAYVTEYEATIPMLLLSLFKEDWDVHKKVTGEVSESYDNSLYRDRLWMEASYADAVILAYEKAGKEIKITDQTVFVLYVAEDAKTDLKAGDEILSIDDQSVSSLGELSSIISKKEIGEKVSIQVSHNKNEYTRTAEVMELDGVKILGIVPYLIRKYEANPKISISYGSSESGPSGGLMVSLAVYNALVEEDITKGLTVVGTGTIDSEGNVGAIGGVEYKLKGADGQKADLFFVPAGENYEEAMALKEKKGYSITIVPVSTFDEALSYLQKNVS